MELSAFEFLDSLADLILPLRKHRHRYHGMFAPNHRLRTAVTAPAIGNAAKQGDEPPCGHAGRTQAAYAYCDSGVKPPPTDTSRIAWAKLLARVGEEFPLACPSCGGDIRLIAFINEPAPPPQDPHAPQ